MICKTIVQVRCDGCHAAWIYPEGDIDAFLTERPRCVRRGK